jgi:hypothetical protein
MTLYYTIATLRINRLTINESGCRTHDLLKTFVQYDQQQKTAKHSFVMPFKGLNPLKEMFSINSIWTHNSYLTVKCLQYKNENWVFLKIITIDCTNRKKCINKVCVTKCKVLTIIACGTLVTNVLRRSRVIASQYPIPHAKWQIETQNLTLNNCSRHKGFTNLLRWNTNSLHRVLLEKLIVT